MLALTSAVVLMFGSAATSSLAQLPAPPLAPAYQPLSDQQLDLLLGPIALYPDPLLAVILPAATRPTDLVLADRYVLSGGDPSQIQFQPWDTSVQAVAHYPAVLQYLDANLTWTIAVGNAFLYQQQQVMESIQRLRVSAENFGNLYSTPQDQVVDDDGWVEIEPANPDVIYVPVYQPAVVYSQSGYGWSFGIGIAFGPWLDGEFDWPHGNICFWRYHRPANWWHETPAQRAAALAANATVWQAGSIRSLGAASGGSRAGNNYSGTTSPSRHGTAGYSPTAPGSSQAAANPIPGVPRNYSGVQIPGRPAPAVTFSSSYGASERIPNRAPVVLPSEPPHVDPPHVDPPHVDPPRVEPPHVEPPHVEPPHPAAPAPATQNDNNSSRR